MKTGRISVFLGLRDLAESVALPGMCTLKHDTE
jgi:hypothetical protein